MESFELIEKYKNYKSGSVEVTVTYSATVTATITVPNDLSIEEIKQELKDNYYGHDMDDNERIKLNKITELIIDGYEIDIN